MRTLVSGVAVMILLAFMLAACGDVSQSQPPSPPPPTSSLPMVTPLPAPPPESLTGKDASGTLFYVWSDGERLYVSHPHVSRTLTLLHIRPTASYFRFAVLDCDGDGADDIITLAKHNEGRTALIIYNETFHPAAIVLYIDAIQYDANGKPKTAEDEFFHAFFAPCLPSWDS